MKGTNNDKFNDRKMRPLNKERRSVGEKEVGYWGILKRSWKFCSEVSHQQLKTGSNCEDMNSPVQYAFMTNDGLDS